MSNFQLDNPPVVASDIVYLLNSLNDWGICKWVVHTGQVDILSPNGTVHELIQRPSEVVRLAIEAGFAASGNSGTWENWELDFKLSSDLRQFAIMQEAVRKGQLDARRRTAEELNRSALQAEQQMREATDTTAFPEQPVPVTWDPDPYEDETVPNPDEDEDEF